MIPYLSQISKKFRSLKDLPQWLSHSIAIQDQIKIIRQSLGMTQNQLAQRLGYTSNNPVAELENKQIDNPTIKTLQEYARALQCELVVRIVPIKEIKAILNEKADEKAREIVNLSVASAAMELQKPDKEVIEQEIERIKKELLEKKKKVLWE